MEITLHIKSYISTLVSLLIVLSVAGQNYTPIEFIENKGQWDSKVKFTGNVPGGAFYLHQSGFTVVQQHPGDWVRMREELHDHGTAPRNAKSATPLTKIRSHAYSVSFVGAAVNPKMTADKPLPGYNNYFIGNDPTKWASECKIYQGVTLENIYPNIDARYYSYNGRLKYDLIVKPGADLSKVALKYDGVDKLEIKNKELVVGTSVGVVKEMAPYSYHLGDKGREEVGVSYKLQGNIIRFEAKKRDERKTLIIDPTFIFASYSGSTADNWGFTATYGPDGSMFGGGIVFGQGFPTNIGAYDETFGGGASCYGNSRGIDIGIIKLSPDGVSRVYATYIGGANGADQPHSLIVDDAGNLILAGRSDASDYPVTGTGLRGPGGGFDIVITKLNAAGSQLIGSKRIGGKGDDGVNIFPCHSGATSLQQNYGDGGRSEVILDGAGNIYVASSTQSSDFPVTAGAFQASAGGGKQDGVVLKYPPDVSEASFATYLGGNNNDAAYVLSINPSNGNVYVAGGTESTNFPGIATGATPSLGTTSQGIDGYVAILSPDGTALLRSSYFGTVGTDQVYGIQFDRAGFPYIMGQTTGNWPVLNATWSMTGGKQFIAKLQPDLSAYVYSTKFGTNSAAPNISPVAFLVDRCENVYVSGWGGEVGGGDGYPTAGTTGLPLV
ncbi:MAG TPA: SBBP repeat-containing protein, partial [Flavisolibacter sp.]